jgi:hypothetical protein
MFIACEEEEVLTKDFPSQLFRPVLFQNYVVANEVDFTWSPIKAASYLLEISKDSLLFTEDVQTFTITSAVAFKVVNLWSNARYSARIKSLSDDPDIKDSEFTELTFVTGTENVFLSYSFEDIGADFIRLKWNISKDVSRIVVLLDNEFVKEVSLSETEKEDGMAVVDGLTANTTYEFRIYLGEQRRGTLKIKTALVNP